MNCLVNYSNFVLNENNLSNSIFVLGCFSEFLNCNLENIRENPFLCTCGVIVGGMVYNLIGGFLIWLVPKSRYAILPILTLSVFAILFKNKYPRTHKSKITISKTKEPETNVESNVEQN